jgi:hypothetical protein
MLDPLLSDRDVSRITGRARSTLQKDRVAGIGIPYVRVGGQVRYRPEDVRVWLAALPTRRSTSEVPRDLGPGSTPPPVPPAPAPMSRRRAAPAAAR